MARRSGLGIPRLWALGLAALLVASAAGARAVRASKKPKPSHIYATWQAPRSADGHRVRLLEDGRVTRRGASRAGTLYFDQPDLLPARLELLDANGQVLDAKVLGRPIAEIARWNLDGDEQFAVTVDYTCGMGSYCGPITLLYRIADQRLKAVESFDRVLGKARPIELMSSLKTGWRRERAPDGTGWDILAVVCRPHISFLDILGELDAGRDPKVEFVTGYVRYQHRDGRWVTDWTQRKRYTDVLSDETVVRLPSSNGRDPYLENEGLSLGKPRRLAPRELRQSVPIGPAL